ncbi:glucosaminidase domain-containing protein [Desulfosediminicola flagellatus]|uniref:glucosaminidase domain-containing protein n=1 Tax=Desulfosediminicola flagellatus TaxID=2569541 RepID=UPI0010ACC77B|nr:glucosaminidase domain-containing protein [Desulfosediminicola flagellatus]
MKISRTAFLSLYTAVSVLFCLSLRYGVAPLLFPETYGGRFSGGVHELAGAGHYTQILDEYDGHLDEIRKSKLAPPVYSENLPINLGRLPVPDKTSIFISLVLPNILRVNNEISATRGRLKGLFEKRRQFKRLTQKEQWWLNRLAWGYGCNPEDTKELLLRVDVVPVALALAQAINESGWGTSRFALEGNALYGQHFSKGNKGQYIVSRRGNVKVAAFDSIYEATRSYIHNLNSVWAYSGLREIRAELKKHELALTGHDLAIGLERYSELGVRYVHDLRYIIKRYELEKLNTVQLKSSTKDLTVQFSR